MNLSERQSQYEETHNNTITRRLPIIIRCDGDNFTRLTKSVEKPFDADFSRAMSGTMLKAVQRISGAVFAYQQSDEITFVLRNDQDLASVPWLNNRVQKIVSKTAGLVTEIFNKELQSFNLDVTGAAYFDARVFCVPDLNEAINNLISRQQSCITNSISSAALHEIAEAHGLDSAEDELHGLNSEERKGILEEELGIVYNKYYPSEFRMGVSCYRIPKIRNGAKRFSWALNKDTKSFVDNRKEIELILKNFGEDIFRGDRDIS